MGLFTWLRRQLGGSTHSRSRHAARLDAVRKNAARNRLAAQEPATLPVLCEANEVPTSEGSAFAIALYQRLRLLPGNLVFSPLSIRLALAMAYVGARGKTATQLGQALRLSASDQSTHATLNALLAPIGAQSATSSELAIANSVWVREGLRLLPEYAEQITRSFGGDVQPCDFTDPAAARARMNQWVEAQTRDRIRDLIPIGCPAGLTQLILISAAHFQALWQQPFAKHRTSPAPFWVSESQSVAVPMMHARLHVVCAQQRGFRMAILPYSSGRMAMLLLLPDRREALPDLEAALSPTLLASCLQATETVETDLYLPRFTITSDSMNLETVLKALGVVAAFDPSVADFSGINGCRPPDDDALQISKVLHKAFVQVDEAGTEAAAATALEMRSLSIPSSVPELRVDHPYLFAICDRALGEVLFLGRVRDPTG